MIQKNKYKSNRLIILSSALFFSVSGVMEIYLFFLSEFRHIPIMALGLLSIIEAFLLIRGENWSIKLIPAIFVIGITFVFSTIYAYMIQSLPFSNILPLIVGLLLYLVTLTVSTAYLLIKKSLQ